MIVVHIKEIREKPLYRWILSLYDTDNKQFQGEEEILIYNEDKTVFKSRLENVLKRFSIKCTNVSSEVRKQIFEANNLKLPEGWKSFQI
jgi:hypothetical protein